MPETIRVAIADDHYLVREGTRQLLEAGGDVQVVAVVGTGAELVDAVLRFRPHVALTDIRMPPTHQLEGIEAAHAIRCEYPDVAVVVLSQHADDAYAHELLRHGTAGLGYLLKERVGDRSELVHALRETIAGRSVIDPLVIDALIARRTRIAFSGLEELTDRERAVLAAMAQGCTNAAIATYLHLSVSAIEKHVNAIFLKLKLTHQTEVHRRVAAVVTFLRGSSTM